MSECEVDGCEERGTEHPRFNSTVCRYHHEIGLSAYADALGLPIDRYSNLEGGIMVMSYADEGIRLRIDVDDGHEIREDVVHFTVGAGSAGPRLIFADGTEETIFGGVVRYGEIGGHSDE